MRHIIFINVLCMMIGCTAREHKGENDAEVDILEYLSEHPHRVSTIHYPDGSTYRPKYGDIKLEEAEKLLAGNYDRPWTITKVIEWYGETTEPKIRAALLYLLAASRDDRAIPYLGYALHDQDFNVRIAGMHGIKDYFMEIHPEGSSDAQAGAVEKWWQDRKGRYEGQ